MCHIHLLKPYYCCSHKPLDAKAEVQPVLLVESTPPVPLQEEIDEGVSSPEDTVLLGRLKNSETLTNLHEMFAHLPESKYADLIVLIKRYVPSLHPMGYFLATSCVDVSEVASEMLL